MPVVLELGVCEPLDVIVALRLELCVRGLLEPVGDTEGVLSDAILIP